MRKRSFDLQASTAVLRPTSRVSIGSSSVKPSSYLSYVSSGVLSEPNENPYKVSTGGMRLRLLESQKSDQEAQKFRAEGLKEG